MSERAGVDPVDRQVFFLVMLVALAVGAWLRLWQIDAQILIDDEWHALHRLMEVGYRDIFLSFGRADYSIPLTLLFNWMAETIGLSERRMRFLPLLFGLASIIAIPLMLRPWLTRAGQATLALLLALSPLLIHFSRVARPYALTVPLSFIAVVALWRWWQDGRRTWLLVYISFTVLAAWLHPLTMMFTFGAASWFGLCALWKGFRGSGWQSFGAIVLVALPTLAACAALVLPPLLADPHAMTSKAGVHQLQPETFLRAWEFYVGGAGIWMVAASVALAVVGAGVLIQRDRWFFLYWLYLLALAVLAIVILDPAWIHHGLVLVRYTVTAQPLVLALIAMGIVTLLGQAFRRFGPRLGSAAMVSGLLALAVVLYVNGPMPKIHDGVNQFTNSLRYHFNYDFDPGINPYSAVMEEVIVHDFYDEMASEEGEWNVVEAPWYFESHYNPLIEYQVNHQRPIRIGMISGLCADWTYGELRTDYHGHVTLRNFVYLRDMLVEPITADQFVVLHRESPFEDAWDIPGFDRCIDAFRERFGPPWRESEAAVVFRLRAETVAADDA